MTVVSLVLSMNARAASTDTFMIVRTASGYYDSYSLRNVEQVYYENKSIEGQVQVQDSFTCTMGGPESMCGSFLSVKNGENLPLALLKMTGGKDVEIEFDGTTFVSASLSSKTELSTNGCSAAIMNRGNNVFGYSTSTGYKGTITVYGELGSKSNCYEMVVTRNSRTSLTLMCVKTADGKVVKYDVENVAEVYYEETTFNQSVTVSGNVGIYTYVNLGLPSGTMWATYNVGATKPTEYGDYFAWGETKPKDSYSISTYKWCKGSSTSMTKYCTSSKFGTKDYKTVLDAEDDAATANWSSAWRMPTIDEIKELRDGCSWEWVNDFSGSGVNGFLGTSKQNGATIFLPAAGLRSSTDLDDAGDYGYYWSSSLVESSSDYACCLRFYDYDIYRSSNGRYCGQSVRAVLR